MCGIAGFLELGRTGSMESLQATVHRMIGALQHRGPDGLGVWADPVSGIALGHRRLAILDLSPAGHQPMISACGRYVISFNGEIYNFAELRKELETKGNASGWRGHSDTEVLLRAISQWGLEAAIKRTVGMFAIALWDRQKRTLHLVRDRMGEKPLYYGRVGSRLVFASELKALYALEEWDRSIDRRALALLLRHSYIPGPYSIYRGIRKLPPGVIFSVRADGQDRMRTYWSLNQVVRAIDDRRFAGSDVEARERLDELLRQAIRGQMIADVPLGAFLSGGLDSSLVVALMQAQSMQPVRTFTIGFGEQMYNEATYAKAVAKHLGTDHSELYVSSADALAVIPRLPALYDEPFADASQIPTYLVSELAHRRVTVSLSGDGGDELFGGYNRYALARSIWRLIGWMPRSVRSGFAAGIRLLSPDAWDKIGGGASRLLPAALRPQRPGEGLYKLAEILRSEGAPAMYRRLVSHWKNPAMIVRDGIEPETALVDQSAWSLCQDYTEQMMYLDSVMYLPDDILVKVDRASMGVSLESRIPLLDHRVVEFAWSLPLSMKIRNGQGKWLLRQVLYQYVPKRLLDRPKMGFGVPIDSWLRGPLKDWAAALLDRRRLESEGFFDPEPIRRKWDEHLSGRHNWQYPLWDVLMFQAWLERPDRRQRGEESLPRAAIIEAHR